MSGGHLQPPWLARRRANPSSAGSCNTFRCVFFVLWGGGFEQSNATVRWTVAHARLDGHDTLICSLREQMSRFLLRCPKKSSGLRYSLIFSTAATRSARFFCHRQRSHRSPSSPTNPKILNNLAFTTPQSASLTAPLTQGSLSAAEKSNCLQDAGFRLWIVSNPGCSSVPRMCLFCR